MIAFISGNTVKSLRRRKGALESFVTSVNRYIQRQQIKLVETVEQAIADRQAAIRVARDEITELTGVKSEIELL